MDLNMYNKNNNNLHSELHEEREREIICD
jgi:hypothetical protein